MDKPVEYEQCDARWKNVIYSATYNKNQTIGISGCGTSSAAMVIATLRNPSITPKETSAWSVANKYRSENSGTEWAFFPAIMKKYEIPCKATSSAKEAIAALKKNYMVICAAGKGIWTNSGHILLAYGLTNNDSKVLINDPNSEATNREIANISNFRTEIRQFWIIEEDWKVEIIKVKIKDLTRNKIEEVDGIKVNGKNYIELRDVELIAPVDIDYDGTYPTIKVNYNS